MKKTMGHHAMAERSEIDCTCTCITMATTENKRVKCNLHSNEFTSLSVMNLPVFPLTTMPEPYPK